MKSICLSAVLFFGFLTCGQAVAQETAVLDPPAVAKAQPVFKDGLAQIVPEFKVDWVKHDLWVETDFDSDKDGKLDRMHVSVCRQKQTETEGLKVPVIYNTSPYFTGVGSTAKEFMWDPNVELNADPPKHGTPPPIPQQSKRPQISTRYVGTWVPRGFAVVHSSSPGTGLSEGCPTVGGDNEALAPKAVIDWLCGRRKGYTSADGSETVDADWCTGKVGMTGTSYEGTLPIAAATTGVQGLEAIIPDAANTSYYHYYRSNGLVRHPGGYMGEDLDVLYNFIHSGDEQMRDNCDSMIRDDEMANNQDRITGDYSDFWAGRDYLNQLDNYKTPTLLSHGLSDWNVMPGHSIRVYEALKKRGVPCQLFLHQGGHGGPPSMKIMNAWFSHYLYGVDNGVELAPRLYVVREDARRRKPTEYANYPHPDAKTVTFFPQQGGSDVGGLSLEQSVTEATEKFSDNSGIYGATLAKAESSPHRLIYATNELTEPLHISGTAKVTVKLASSKPAANLSVWLVSMPWESKPKPDENGKAKRIKLTDNLITRGWADPQNHASLTESKPLVPGDFYSVTFSLEPDDQIVAAGQKIGLMIFSSDRDFTLWPEPGTDLTVDLNGTKLELPIVGGAAAVKTASE
jgi:X-Pro dipeptidyl-peptidase